MNRIEQIKAEQKKLAEELESEMLKERANVLAKMKEDIKLFGFKTSDFKGVLATRKKLGTTAKNPKTKPTNQAGNPNVIQRSKCSRRFQKCTGFCF